MDYLRELIDYIRNNIVPSLTANVLANILAAAILSLAVAIFIGLGRRFKMILFRFRVIGKVDPIARDHWEQEQWYLKRFLELVEKSRWDPNKFVRPDFKLKPWKSTSISPRLMLIGDKSKKNVKTGDLGVSSKRITNLLDIVLKLRKVVILGDPGSGKTVSLLQTGVEVANKGLLLDSLTPLLPVYVSLGEYISQRDDGSPEDIDNFIISQLRSQIPKRTGEEFISRFDVLKRDGRFLFILDAIDEMPRSDYYPRFYKLWSFVQGNSNNLFLVSCRFLDYIDDPAFPFHQAIISPFSEAQTKRMLKLYLGKEYKRLVTREFLENEDFSLQFRSPFIVSLVAACWKAEVSPSASWNVLLENYVDIALEESRKYYSFSALDKEWRVLRDDTLSWLSQLAFMLTEYRATGTKADRTFVERTLISYESKEYIIDVAHRSGIIKLLSDYSIKFYHHRLQEFFAAKQLVELVRESKINITAMADDIWWQEVIVMSMGLIPDPDELILALLPSTASLGLFNFKEIDESFNHITLAIKCYSAAKERLNLQTVRLLKGHMQPYLLQGNILQKVRMLRLVPRFINDRELLDSAQYSLKDSSWWVRETALLAISEMLIYIPEASRILWRNILKPNQSGVIFRFGVKDIPALWQIHSTRKYVPVFLVFILYRLISSIIIFLGVLTAFTLLWFFGLWGASIFAVTYIILVITFYYSIRKRILPILPNVLEYNIDFGFNQTSVAVLVFIVPLWSLLLGYKFLGQYFAGILLFALASIFALIVLLAFTTFMKAMYKWRGLVFSAFYLEEISDKMVTTLEEYDSLKEYKFSLPAGISIKEREHMALKIIDEAEYIRFPDIRAKRIESLLNLLPVGETVLRRLEQFNNRELHIDTQTKGWQIYEQIHLNIQRTDKEKKALTIEEQEPTSSSILITKQDEIENIIPQTTSVYPTPILSARYLAIPEQFKAEFDRLCSQPVNNWAKVFNKTATELNVRLELISIITGETVHTQDYRVPANSSEILQYNVLKDECSISLSSDQQIEAVTLFDIFILPKSFHFNAPEPIFYKIHYDQTSLALKIRKSHVDLIKIESDIKEVLGQVPHETLNDRVIIKKDVITTLIEEHPMNSLFFLSVYFDLDMLMSNVELDRKALLLGIESEQFSLKAETLPKEIEIIR